MKSIYLFFLLAASLSAQIQVTISLELGGDGATGFANSQNVETSGMPIGIVIDTAGNGFAEGLYESFDINNNGQFLQVNGDLSDDWYCFSFEPEYRNTLWSPFFEGAVSSFGVLIDSSYTGKTFEMIWFETDAAIGAPYGMANHANFVLPSEGRTTLLPETSWVPGYANLTIIPEPKRLSVILGMGCGFFLLWRRKPIFR